MKDLSDTEITSAGTGRQGGISGRVTMHPDDFAGLLAWTTAKRFHEPGPEKSPARNSPFISG
jgi:hypothetical protein